MWISLKMQKIGTSISNVNAKLITYPSIAVCPESNARTQRHRAYLVGQEPPVFPPTPTRLPPLTSILPLPFPFLPAFPSASLPPPHPKKYTPKIWNGQARLLFANGIFQIRPTLVYSKNPSPCTIHQTFKKPNIGV